MRGAFRAFCFLFSEVEALLKALVRRQTKTQTMFDFGVAPATSQAQSSKLDSEANSVVGK